MTLPQLTLAILALLITPGPTNALLALSGAQNGVQRSLPLIPVEAAAYLSVIAPLLIWGAPVMQRAPVLTPILAGAAALWVAHVALELWHRPTVCKGAAPSVGATRLAITTLLNPKALIIGLVLMPAVSAPVTALLVFTLVMPPVSLLWVTLGAGVLSRAGRWLNRGAALWLAALSLLLAARAFAG